MFKNVKVGDRVWDFLYKYGEVIQKTDTKLEVRFKDPMKPETIYTLEGKMVGTVYPQTLFWDEIKFEIPKKHFDLRSFIVKNLERKKFTPHESNYFLFWDNNAKEVKYDVNTEWESFQPYFMRDNISLVVETLNEKGITKEEFKKIIKELYM